MIPCLFLPSLNTILLPIFGQWNTSHLICYHLASMDACMEDDSQLNPAFYMGGAAERAGVEELLPYIMPPLED